MDYRLPEKPRRKFSLGRTVYTPAAYELVQKYQYEPSFLFALHVCGIWGDLSKEDRDTNDDALKNGGRLMSSYILNSKTGEKVWIITEWDRSATTLLLPDEY